MPDADVILANLSLIHVILHFELIEHCNSIHDSNYNPAFVINNTL